MKIVTNADVPAGPDPHHVDARQFYDTEDAPAGITPLPPGGALKKHITPVDVFFSVPEGTGIVEIGDERAGVGTDHPVESPARIPHRWMNESGSPVRVLVVKAPRPTRETGLL